MENHSLNSNGKYDGDKTAVIKPIRTDLSFLAQDVEAHGLIADVRPLAKDEIMAAARGFRAPTEASPIYTLPDRDAGSLTNGLFKDLFEDPHEAEAAVRVVFGHDGLLDSAPLSRYAAAMAEIIAVQSLERHGSGSSHEQARAMLNRALEDQLRELRQRFSSPGKLSEAPNGEELAISLCVCRVRAEANDEYLLDVYAAGNYCVYLLDEYGMSPVWKRNAREIVPGEGVLLDGKRLRIHHPKPFAVLLVSENVYDPYARERHTPAASGGLVWRDRMRLEDDFFRLISDCVYSHEFGERAEVFFTGHLRSHHSAAGAILVQTGGSSFEVFRNRCRARLSELEKLFGLLPHGYDADNPPTIPPRYDMEMRYLRELVDRDPALISRMREALRSTVLAALSTEPAAPPPPPEGVPQYARPDRSKLNAVYRSYDCENDEDRARIRENRAMLRETVSEHWVTLRPVLMDGIEADDPHGYHARAQGDRMYSACLDMNQRLTRMLNLRKHTVLRLEEILSDSLDALRYEGNDWICARAGAESTKAWTDRLQDALPMLLDHLRDDWGRDTEHYRCLHSAYTAERDRLFRLDTSLDTGFFARDWQSILLGTLTAERGEQLRERLANAPETAGLLELWDAALRISRGTGALVRRINARAAESRTAREIADRTTLCIDALRGAAYEDPAWGKSVIAVMDTATRNDYRATVRRWQESDTLIKRQAEAYTEYSTMYARYL